MLLRISLIVAILAGLGAGGLGFYEFNTQIPALKDQRDAEHGKFTTEQGEHNKTKTALKKTQSELATTQQELADTKSERDKALARADAQEKRANDLSDKLDKTKAERDAAQNELAAYKATDLTPEQIVALNGKIKEANKKIAAIEGEKAALGRSLAKAKAELDRILGTNPDIPLPAGLAGKVEVVDPKWDFVVLNIGDDQGVIEDGQLLVSRNGKLVAKVVVKSVMKSKCVANVIPGWKLSDLYEGDVVTPAHPAS